MRRQSSERGKNLSSRAAKDIYERTNLSRFIGDRNEPRNIVSVLKQIRRPATIRHAGFSRAGESAPRR